LVSKERLCPPALFFSIVAMILWGFALWFFLNSLTSWQVSKRNSEAPKIMFIAILFISWGEVVAYWIVFWAFDLVSRV